MKVKIKDLKPGMVVVANFGPMKGKRIRLSNLPKCPHSGKPNYDETHEYAYLRWYKNLLARFAEAVFPGDGENVEIERIK